MATKSSRSVVLVTLHRLFPVSRSLLPGRLVFSRSKTSAPISAARPAAIMPPAPAPVMTICPFIGTHCIIGCLRLLVGRRTTEDVWQPPFNPLAPNLGGREREDGGHPQTSGRDESLHPIRISSLGFGPTITGL